MNKGLFKTIFFLLISTVVFAQKESRAERKYEDRSFEVQDEVWGKPDSAFNVTTVPDKYKDESAVIIAKSILVTTAYTLQNFHYYTTVRERVLIKDKVSLNEYSTLSYNKTEDGIQTYIGAKIIKPNGKVIIVNSLAEEVLTENKKDSKVGKLAVPDLQVGDILDYYFYVEDILSENANTKGPYIYLLQDVHPILYYKLYYDLNKRCSVDMLNVNGAENLKNNSTDDRLILTTTQRELPRISTTLWTSPIREVPYYIIRYSFGGSTAYDKDIIAKNGAVLTGPFTDILKNKLKTTFYIMARTCDKTPYKNMLNFYGGKKNIEGLPIDSITNYFYNYYRWSQYGTFADMNVSNERNKLGMNSYAAAVAFTEMLKMCDINCDLVLTTDRFSTRSKDVFTDGDFNVLVKVTANGKLKWFSFNDFFEDAGQILSNFQGENALLLTREGGRLARFKDTEEPLVLPVSKDSENVSAENIKVTLYPNNLQLAIINRTCTETGSMKHADQQNLLLPEDVEANLAATIGSAPTTVVLSENKATRAQAAESQTALDNERLKQKDYFKKEIKDKYDQDPKELLSYKINNVGLSIYNPVFEYNEVFTMDNFVKKAGDNFIFEVGKLMGTYTSADKKDSVRTMNIYMLCARTFKYKFSITIPDGYTVEGIDALNKNVENNVASFSSAAKLDANVLTVTVNRSYNDNFEPAVNWPKLEAVMDAAADFTTTKLLLQKK